MINGVGVKLSREGGCMRLPPQETARFYRIWFALLHYVNTQLHLVPAFPATPGVETVSTEVTLKLRDALWANDALREQFIAENPAQLPAEDLALVASWQYRLAGSFYIFRSLQHYTIFLSTTTPAHAYGVLGLVSTIEETLPLPLPVYTQAVLLPFEHHIMYDSLITSYNVLFGSGYRQDLAGAVSHYPGTRRHHHQFIAGRSGGTRGQSTHRPPRTEPQGVRGLSSRVTQSRTEPADSGNACRRHS